MSDLISVFFILFFIFILFFFVSALIKQVNKSIDGTADDEEEGVPTEEAIRAGLELLKVRTRYLFFNVACFQHTPYVLAFHST